MKAVNYLADDIKIANPQIPWALIKGKPDLTGRQRFLSGVMGSTNISLAVPLFPRMIPIETRASYKTRSPRSHPPMCRSEWGSSSTYLNAEVIFHRCPCFLRPSVHKHGGLA